MNSPSRQGVAASGFALLAMTSLFLKSRRPSSQRRRISKLRGGVFHNDFGADEDFFVAYKPRLTLRTVVHSRHYIIDFASLKLFQGALFL
jgi:alanine-alpha-ketoisovalerate/valine-pyruvate aminotransferase